MSLLLSSKVFSPDCQGKMPEDGWEDREVEQVLAQLSAMDSNNFPANCGVGEREARLFSRQGSRYFESISIFELLKQS